MNKTTKRAAKWGVGILLMALLCWNLYQQIHQQLHSGLSFDWWPAGSGGYFVAAFLLLTINIGIESRKWQTLIDTATNAGFWRSAASVLSGIAASVITPNRIGEYPGRILALEEHRSTRLISVSVLGACSQMLSLMIAGMAGLAYYTSIHPKPLYIIVLLITLVFTILLGRLYFSFELWAPRIERWKLFRRLKMWARLLHRFSRREHLIILGYSLARLVIFTLQFWLLLHWQGINLSFISGMLLCALFFWAMAIIPSISLAELGIRGNVALYLLNPYSSNVAGIALSVLVLWLINLMLPALAGTLLFLKRGRR